MDEEKMIERIVAAAEKGHPGDRAAQVRAVASVSARAPAGMLGAFLKALEKLTLERQDG